MDYLRPHLQPITHNLPPPLRTLGLSLLGPACYKTLLLDLSLTPSPCLSLALSKTLGLAIIAASSIVKIPQILKLLQSQSAAGVSFLAYVLEIAADIVGVTYNARGGNPFSTYGESALILAQNVVVAGLVLRFSGRSGLAGVFVVGLVGVGWVLQAVRWEWLAVAQVGAGVAGVVSKAPQIWTVWRQGGTGQLSAFAVGGFFFGLSSVCLAWVVLIVSCRF
jgi:mannose-P-dolichol utilization defect protein 1